MFTRIYALFEAGEDILKNSAFVPLLVVGNSYLLPKMPKMIFSQTI
jgi:hypothetical protein